MNAKGIKFLAILAVLAMAFAAVAVVGLGNEAEAGDTPVPTTNVYTSPGATAADTKELVTGNSYTITSDKYATSGKVTITDKTGTTASTIYLLPNAELTIQKVSGGSITVMTVTESNAKLSESGFSAVVIEATALKIANSTGVTVSGAGKVSELTNSRAVSIDKEADITLNGAAKNNLQGSIANTGKITVTKDGSIVNSGSITTGGQDVSAITSVKGQVILNGATVTGYSGSAIVAGASASFSAEAATTAVEAYEATYGSSSTIEIKAGTVTVEISNPGQQTETSAWALTVDKDATLNLGKMLINKNSSITNNGKIVIPAGVTIVNEGTITNTTSIENNGTIDNKGTITGKDGAISGTGSLLIKGTYSSTGVIAGGYPAVTCDMTLYNGCTFTGFTGTYFSLDGATGEKALDVKISATSAGAISGLSYTMYSSVSIKKAGTFDAGYPDTVTVKAGTLTFAAALTIEANDTFTFEEGALTAGTAAIVNNGTIAYASADQYYNNITNNKTITIAGATVKPTTETVITTENVNPGETVVATAAVTSATVPQNATVVITDASAIAAVDVSAAGSEVAIKGLAAKDFTLTIDTKKVEFTGITGTVTLAKGSIIVKGDPWSAGTITLNDGDELKISGTIDGEVTIALADGASSAKVTIVDDTTLTIAAGGKITIADKITTDIHGTFINAAGDNKANINGNLNIYGTVEGYITAAKDPVIYDGADVSGAIFPGKNPSGNDGKGGKWTYDTTSNTLTLNNYNGAPYFSKAAYNGMKTVVLIGDNSLTLEKYEMAAGVNAIFNVNVDEFQIKSLSGQGSLTINVNITKDKALASFVAVNNTNAAGRVTITGVDVNINIAGTATTATGISTFNLKVFNSATAVSVCPTVSDSAIIGIKVSHNAEIEAAEVSAVAGKIGMEITGDATVKASEINAMGAVYGLKVGGLFDVSQSSAVTVVATELASNSDVVPYALYAGQLNNYSYSKIKATSLFINGESKNYAEIENNGDMVINGAFENLAGGKIVNNGVIGIFGSLKITAGEVTNDGFITVFQGATVATPTVNPAAGTSAYVSEFKVLAVDYKLADGTAYIKAQVKLDGVTPVNNYYGIATYDDNGTLTSANLMYVSTDDNGMQYVSNVVISAGLATNSTTTYAYNIVSSGSIYSEGVIATVGTTTYGTAAAGVQIGILNTFVQNAYVQVNGGTLVNNGTLTIDSAAAELTKSGTLTNNGIMIVTTNVTVNGGTLANAGALGFAKNLTISKGKVTGGFVIGDGSVVTIKGAEIDSEITYKGTYKYTAPGSTTPVELEFSNVLDVEGKGAGDGIVITATTNTNAPSTLDVTGMTNVDDKAGIELILSEGIMMLKSNIATKGYIAALAGSVLQAASAVNDEGVIAIQDGAVFNRWIDNDTSTYTYGKVTYVIEFASEGYTYYGNLAFALANAPENTNMTLSSSTSITTDTEVKDGVVLTLADGVTLDVKGKAGDDGSITLTMGDGAKFVLPAGAKINFEYVTASADIEFGDNVLLLDETVFTTPASTVTATAGTTTVPAQFTLAFDEIKDGTVELAAGNSTGTIKLAAVMSELDPTVVLTNGALVIDEDATSSISIVPPAANADKVGVQIDGVLKVTANNTTLFAIPITGDGAIVLSDGVSITSVKGVKQNIAVGNGTDGWILADAVDFTKPATQVGGKDVTYTIKSVAKTATAAAYVQLTGAISKGTATAVGNVTISNLELTSSKAIVAVPEGAVLTIEKTTIAAADSTTGAAKDYSLDATGLVKVAGTINMYTESTTTYGIVHYDITYADAGYTVYTVMASAIKEAPAGTSFEVGDNLLLTENTTIKPGMSIVIAEGKYIQVPAGGYLVIGEGFDSLGAAAIVSGNIVLNGNNSFVVDFVGSGSDITVYTTAAMTTKAKETGVIAQDAYYATIFTINKDATNFTNVMQGIVEPEIKGYYFSYWAKLNGNPVGNPALVEGPFVAHLVSSQVTVTFVAVDGVDYYVDGFMQNILDAPVKVEYGATVTAKISDTSKYQGTPLVNGKAYILIDDTVSKVTGSGVAPIPEPPQPEPEPVVGDSGLSLTDILLIVLVILIAIMVVILVLRLNRS